MKCFSLEILDDRVFQLMFGKLKSPRTQNLFAFHIWLRVMLYKFWLLFRLKVSGRYTTPNLKVRPEIFFNKHSSPWMNNQNILFEIFSQKNLSFIVLGYFSKLNWSFDKASGCLFHFFDRVFFINPLNKFFFHKIKSQNVITTSYLIFFFGRDFSMNTFLNIFYEKK